MFSRKVLGSLQDWKARQDRKPLILRGARQVGKTSLVRMFSKSFSHYIELNLEKPEDMNIFEKRMPFPRTIEGIFYSRDLPQSNQPTLIFIDEIQNSPEAVKSLRYFHEERPDLFVIAAGSMLESLIDKKISFPVGRVEYLAVHPCSFPEFLAATGEETSLELLREINVPDYAHERILGLFNRYALIGGMPAILNNYVKYSDISRLSLLYDSLLTSYLDDVEKYATTNAMERVLRHLIGTSFPYSCTRIKFEGFGNSKYKSREVGEGFRILEKTMLLQLNYPVESTLLPLVPNLRKSPKLNLLDVGLVNYISGVTKEVFDSNDITDVYRGKIAEQVVGQDLFSGETSVMAKLFFWPKEEGPSQAEVD